MAAMGCGRDLVRAIIAIALLLGGSVATAVGPPRSGWTPLPDPNAGFVPFSQPHRQSTPDGRADQLIAAFSAEVARAIAVQRQENEVVCRASAAGHHSLLRSADWHAHCSYRRY